VWEKITNNGYQQIRMAKEDIEKTTFDTHQGHYQFLMVPWPRQGFRGSITCYYRYVMFLPCIKDNIFNLFKNHGEDCGPSPTSIHPSLGLID
jgi:hypothetical protein